MSPPQAHWRASQEPHHPDAEQQSFPGSRWERLGPGWGWAREGAWNGWGTEGQLRGNRRRAPTERASWPSAGGTHQAGRCTARAPTATALGARGARPDDDPRAARSPTAEKRKPPVPRGQRGSSKKIRQRPTLPRGFPRSTIGSGGLNFRVRDGNGCDPSDIATGK